MIAALNAAAETWFGYMASATLHATVLAAIVLLLVSLGRVRRYAVL